MSETERSTRVTMYCRFDGLFIAYTFWLSPPIRRSISMFAIRYTPVRVPGDASGTLGGFYTAVDSGYVLI